MRAVDFTSQLENQPVVEWPSVDFVTDRGNLRKLLRWIEDVSAGKAPFRIDMQLAGDGAVLMNRWEKRTRERGHPSSYGFNLRLSPLQRLWAAKRPLLIIA